MDTLIDSLPGNLLTILKVAGGVIGVYLFLIWIASLFWAYRDMRSRTHDFVTRLAGVSVMLFLPLIGYPVYLAVRPALTLREAYDRQLEQEAILSELQAAPTCPECRRPIEADWMICAFCSYALKQPCRGCDRLLMNSWRHCPYCAGPREQPAAPEPVEEPATADEGAALDDATTRRRRRAARTAAASGVIPPVTRPPRPSFQEEAEREPVGGSASSQV
ncbi:MAG: zinc ribbon domain-containing protein [Chloroflexi bacterium]|nr:zinc ribbon domain-containing protein [Chloroflexota bacterium]